jgi:hypothetical protein
MKDGECIGKISFLWCNDYCYLTGSCFCFADIDECLADEPPCSDYEYCTNTIGSKTCKCLYWKIYHPPTPHTHIILGTIH